tara:strand:+ start:8820 stop:10046 length:1227 start_codon:yes stop_codon:yes gene_type:complete
MDILRAYHTNKNVIKKTTLHKNNRLSERYNCNVYFKREDLQVVRSFKVRGAYNKIAKLSQDDKNKGIVCASAGNHAQGVAYSAAKLNIKADIFVPENTPLQKIKSVRKFSDDNCTLHITGKNFDECLNKARNMADDNGNVFIHPFDDKDVVDGQGTIAVEIYEELQPDIIIGCIGGGGLMAGISLYSKHVNPGCILYGAESEDCCAMYKSIKSGNVVSLKSYDTFVDGASVKEVGKLNYEICKKNLEQVLLIDNGLLCKNILELYQDDGIVTEPAGALAVSSLSRISKDILQNKNVVCIISGGNNDITRYPEISEIALRYDNLKHYFIIQFRQKPGELKKFVNNILGPNDDITRFEYIKKTNKSYGQVLVGVELTHPDDLPNIMQNLEENNFNYKYINDDELLMSYVV